MFRFGRKAPFAPAIHHSPCTPSRSSFTFSLLLPMFFAFGKETETVYASLRVAHGQWKYLLYSFAYVLTLSAFCYALSLFALQKKKHI